MERSIEQRRIARILFTKCATKFENTLADANRTKATVTASYVNLKSKFDSLSSLDNTILDHWLDLPERDEEAYGTLIESSEEFVEKWHLLHQKYNDFVKLEDTFEAEHSRVKSKASNSSISSKDRCKTLPSLDLPKFNGDPRKWLYFWRNFKKVNDDNDMENDVKLHYLLQCMEPESPAQKLFDSFPPTAESYSKVVEEMKTRFGRDELLIEVYVKEILSIVLDRHKTRMITSVSEIYKRIKTPLDVLDSLNVTSDKYGAILRPLLESALPSDLLRIWQSKVAKRNEHKSCSLHDLLSFLKDQAENGERKKTNKGNKSLQTPNMKKCIFCDLSSHLSSNCEDARKMSEQELMTAVHQNRACRICLCKGHWHKYCRNKKIVCAKCGDRHYTFMCSDSTQHLHSDTGLS